MAPEAPREQEQSIKARKRELFAEEQPSEETTRGFTAYLAETPPNPLSRAQKLTLGALFGLVLLLLLIALVTRPGPRRHPRAVPARAPASHAAGH
jgi:hypothetical protein